MLVSSSKLAGLMSTWPVVPSSRRPLSSWSLRPVVPWSRSPSLEIVPTISNRHPVPFSASTTRSTFLFHFVPTCSTTGHSSLNGFGSYVNSSPTQSGTTTTLSARGPTHLRNSSFVACEIVVTTAARRIGPVNQKYFKIARFHPVNRSSAAQSWIVRTVFSRGNPNAK